GGGKWVDHGKGVRRKQGGQALNGVDKHANGIITRQQEGLPLYGWEGDAGGGIPPRGHRMPWPRAYSPLVTAPEPQQDEEQEPGGTRPTSLAPQRGTRLWSAQLGVPCGAPTYPGSPRVLTTHRLLLHRHAPRVLSHKCSRSR